MATSKFRTYLGFFVCIGVCRPSMRSLILQCFAWTKDKKVSALVGGEEDESCFYNNPTG